MTLIESPHRYTPEDVARLSDEHGKLYELVGGELVEKSNMSGKANWTAGELIFHLRSAFPTSKAFVFPEQTTYCFADGHCRRPDVCLVWASRLPAGPSDEDLHLVPDFVVEIVSPTNKVDDQFRRVQEYLEAGVPLVWVIHPARNWIQIFRKDGSVGLLTRADVLKDEPLLPGLVLRVADIFLPAQPPGSTNS